MRVNEYRELIDALNDAHRDTFSCVGDHEMRLGCSRLERAYQEVLDAECKKKTLRDSLKASIAMRKSCDRIAELRKRFKLADAMFQKMAFAGEWK